MMTSSQQHLTAPQIRCHLSVQQTPSIPVVPARREFTWDISTGIAAYDDTNEPRVALGFTDSHGKRWLRDDRTLQETTGADVFHYAQEDPAAAAAQIGAVDPARNPMIVAHAFADLLWVEEDQFDQTVFLSLLDPLANGWQGAWDNNRVQQLRDLFSNFSNLAALAWYGAPRVAYARIFSDASLGQLSKAGTAVAVEGLFITLVYRGEQGWRVFGVGERYRPDQIFFPDAESAGERTD